MSSVDYGTRELKSSLDMCKPAPPKPRAQIVLREKSPETPHRQAKPLAKNIDGISYDTNLKANPVRKIRSNWTDTRI